MADKPNTGSYPAQKTSDAVNQRKHLAMGGTLNTRSPSGPKTPA